MKDLHPKSHHVFQTIVNSRKSYKMLKGNTEIVWPPYLEEAMLKGFESYQPEDCRETRLLGRFPMRNQFISEYIYRTTGKRRSAKQVGSRLQQLRDTYEGKRLLAQLSSHYNLGGKKKPSTPSSSSSSSPFANSNSPNSSPSSTPPPTPLDTTLERRTFVRIDILPPSLSCTGTPTSPVFSSNGVTDVFRPSSSPRPICSIDPTITLLSRSLIAARSMCTVLLDGGAVHEELTELALVGPGPGESEEGLLLYNVKLVPKFWDSICQSQDPTRFTIVQKVTRIPPAPATEGGGGEEDEEETTLFSALYQFSYPTTTPLPSPPPHPSSQNNNNTYFPYQTPTWDTHDSRESSSSPIEQTSYNNNIPDISGFAQQILDTHQVQDPNSFLPSFHPPNPNLNLSFIYPTSTLLPDNYIGCQVQI